MAVTGPDWLGNGTQNLGKTADFFRNVMAWDAVELFGIAG